MIQVKYTEKYSEDGYSYLNFNSYEDFGKWIFQNYHKVNVWEMKQINI